MKVSVIFFLCLFSLNATADILFLDLNNAPEEFQAAQRAAALRRPPEKVIVIPSVNSDQRRIQDQLSRQADSLATRIQKTCPSGASSENCEGLRQQYEQVSSDLRNATTTNQVSLEKIRSELKKLEAQGVHLSSVVISGHDGNGKFTGVYGNLSADGLEKAFAGVPRLSGNVRSVLLWGCYTTSLGSIDGHWKSVFPNVAVFAGFDGRGPNKYIGANHTYLEDFLKVDKTLIEANDKAEVKKIVEGIRGFQIMASSICVKDMVATPSGVRDVASLRAECQITPHAHELLGIYQCYLQARDPKCANPPTETASGPLRELYSEVYKKSHCRGYWADLGQSEAIPDPQEIQRLLFFNNVKLNLGSLHRADLQQIDQALIAAGAKPELKVSDFAGLTRAQIMDRLGKISAFLDSPASRSAYGEKAIQLDFLRGAISEVNGIVSNLERTPDGWHEPGMANRSFLLTAAMSNQRVDEISVDRAVSRLEQTYAPLREKAITNDPRGAELERRYQQALSGIASSRPEEREQKRAELIAASTAVSSRRKEIERDSISKIASQVRQEMQQKKMAGQLSMAEEKAYQKYLEQIQTR